MRIFINNIINKFLYVSIQQAKGLLDEKLEYYKEVDWARIMITRDSFLLHQLRILELPFYGCSPLRGKVELIPDKFTSWFSKETAWDHDKIIYLRTNEILYTGLCVRKSKLLKAIKCLKNNKMFIMVPRKQEKNQNRKKIKKFFQWHIK